ncbi:MAG: glycosyltransferase [Proteobacteria bacterium]|nr:glycosyltransferase [Pseudomonadota bacterium]
MKIGFISTYPPIECGIATYTKYLTDALWDHEMNIYVVSHRGGSGKNVFTAFDYDDGNLAERAFSMMIRLTPDIVHIQHEFGLYGKHFGVSVIPLILKFRLVGIPVVTTLHTVYDKVSDEHDIILTSIIENSAVVIVHELYQLEALRNHFKKKELLDKIHVIPHGAREARPIEDAKASLEIPDDTKVVLMIGYFRPTKGFERIIRLWPRIAERYGGKNIKLIIAGKTRGIEHRDYRNMLFNEINSSPARNTIEVIRGQISQDSFDTILSASDIVALPYSISSQSGIVAHCLALGKPIITSDTHAMVSLVEESGAGLVCNTDQDYIENIGKILKDDDLRKEISENALRYVRDNISWSRVARRHIEIYKTIVEPSVLRVDTIWMD